MIEQKLVPDLKHIILFAAETCANAEESGDGGSDTQLQGR